MQLPSKICICLCLSCTCTHTRTHTCVYIYMCVYVYVYICICIYIHTPLDVPLHVSTPLSLPWNGPGPSFVNLCILSATSLSHYKIQSCVGISVEKDSSFHKQMPPFRKLWLHPFSPLSLLNFLLSLPACCQSLVLKMLDIGLKRL